MRDEIYKIDLYASRALKQYLKKEIPNMEKFVMFKNDSKEYVYIVSQKNLKTQDIMYAKISTDYSYSKENLAQVLKNILLKEWQEYNVRRDNGDLYSSTLAYQFQLRYQSQQKEYQLTETKKFYKPVFELAKHMLSRRDHENNIITYGKNILKKMDQVDLEEFLEK